MQKNNKNKENKISYVHLVIKLVLDCKFYKALVLFIWFSLRYELLSELKM